MKTGKIKNIIIISVLVILSMTGCSTKSFIFGHEEGFCAGCGFKYKGVCANPMDIYYNSDAIVNKKTKCLKEKSKRKGIRK